MKTCTSCKVLQNTENFSNQGFDSWCRKCHSAYVKGWRKRNYDYFYESVAKRNQEIKLEVLRYYGGGNLSCACCKEQHIEFLTIDHINGDGSNHRREIGRRMYLWIIKNNFPNDLQSLCYNCNWAKYHSGLEFCPHLLDKTSKINEKGGENGQNYKMY